MKAQIIPDKKDAVWLLIQRGENIIQNAELQYIKGVKREEDTSEKVAYPILKNEVVAIKEACQEYLMSIGEL